MSWSSGASKRTRRQVFQNHFDAFGDLGRAAQAAGVSLSEARRWRDSPPASGSFDLTSFVGREKDVEAIGSRFASGARLVSLVGPPGIGKTRLASQVLNEAPSTLPHRFVDLRKCGTAEDLCAGVARHLDVHLAESGSSVDWIASLGRAMESRGRCLLVLDNVEQLAASIPSVLNAWLYAAPRLWLLVTSRCALRIRGEHVYEVDPLALPRSEDDCDCDAMRLFSDRACAVEPSFIQESPASVYRIVRRLGGVPLAIEIAASQLRKRSAEGLLRQVKQAALDMTDTRHGVVEDHRSLRLALDSSWRLLPEAERRALMQASVFRGPFSAEAADAVLGSEAGQLGSSGSDLISALRDASLVRRVSTGQDVRWDVLESVREYALGQSVDPHELSDARNRHAEYFLERGRRLAELVHGDHGLTALQDLRSESDDLQAALDWFLDSSDASRGFGLALALHELFRKRLPARSIVNLSRCLAIERGVDIEARQLRLSRAEAYRITDSYELASNDLDALERLENGPAERAATECERGLLWVKRGRYGLARHVLRDALALAHESGSAALEGKIRLHYGYVLGEANAPEALEQLRCAETLFGEIGDRSERIAAGVAHAMLQVRYEPSESGRRVLEARLEDARKIEDVESISLGLSGLGWYALENGDLEDAVGYANASRAAAAGAGLRYQAVCALMQRGMSLDEAGKSSRARIDYDESVREFERMGAPSVEGWCRLLSGGLSARDGDVEKAERQLHRALECFRGDGTERWRNLLKVQTIQLDVARSKRARESGDAVRAVRFGNRAVHRFDRFCPRTSADAGAPRGGPSSSPDIAVRFLLLRLERQVGELVAPILAVSLDGSSFQVGRQSAVELPKGPVIRRVLKTLMKRRTEAPGASVTAEELLEEAWPGERISYTAGLSRVRNIVLRLRRAGLKDVLVTTETGYLLDPNTAIGAFPHETI